MGTILPKLGRGIYTSVITKCIQTRLLSGSQSDLIKENLMDPNTLGNFILATGVAAICLSTISLLVSTCAIIYLLRRNRPV